MYQRESIPIHAPGLDAANAHPAIPRPQTAVETPFYPTPDGLPGNVPIPQIPTNKKEEKTFWIADCRG